MKHLQTPAPERPIALTPIFDGIPAELKPLQIWACFRFEWAGKLPWKKVPYIPIAGKHIKAKSNDPRTWRSYEEAKAVYLAGGFDGVGIFATGDLVFGDFDKSYDPATGQLSDFAREYMPQTYGEQSVGGYGAHFIALGTIERARKKPRGELYAVGSPRFLTITGRRLAGQPATIERCQEAINRYAAALDQEPGSKRSGRTGSSRTSTRDKSRKQLAAEIPESLREEARQLYRTQGERLERRFKTAAWKEETQWWCVARREYALFHARYPFVGLYDADGVLDPSQARMAAGRAIRGLGFSLPEYAALMTRYFASDRAEMLARWGNKDTWWEELADIWNKSAPPKRGIWQPKPAVAKRRKPVGRASDHAAQVERVYALLQQHRDGDTATIKTADLAREAGMHRVTLAGILAELRNGRIQTQRLGRYGGLLITFSDVAILAEQAPESSAETQQTKQTTAGAIEDTHTHTVSLPESREPGYSSQLPTLAQLAAHYLDQQAQVIGEQLVSKKTGQITYRRTAKHFAQLVSADYGDWYTKADALEAYATEQERRELVVKQAWARFFVRLRTMTDAELIEYIRAGCRREVSELSRDGSAFDKHQYQTRLRCAKQHLGWRGLKMPEKATRIRTAKPGAAWLPDEVPVSSQRLPMESLPDSLPSTLPLFAQREAAHG